MPVHLEKSQQDPRFLKSNYKWVLNHSKHSKNPPKSLKNSQIPPKPLFVYIKAFQTPKIPQVPSEPPKNTVLPFKASKTHIFLSRPPFSVILTSKFLEFIILSIDAFIHDNCFLHCIYLSIVCFAIGNPVLEPLFEDFQEQVFEEPDVFFSGQQGNCPSTNRTYIPIYYVVYRIA
jgi:hypothetical protein